MKELQIEEMASVTGAGLIADAAAALGEGIGRIVDVSCNTGTQATTAGQTMGRGIGMIVEASVNIFQGIFGGISTLFNK